MAETGRTDLEIAVLRGLISRAAGGAWSSATDDAGELGALLGGIASHLWADEEHRVVYGCLRSAQGLRKTRLREEMAAEATRMGHPDVDWDLYFQPPSSESDDTDLLELIRRLKNNP